MSIPSNSIISTTSLVPIQRPLVMRALDYPGYVPILNIPTGIIRIIVSVAGIIIAGIGALFTCRSRSKFEKCLFTVKYLSDEFNRGFAELQLRTRSYDRDMKPDLSQISDQDRHFTLEVKPSIHGASGKYIYQIENEGMRYSTNRYTNQFTKSLNKGRADLYNKLTEI